MKRSRVKLLLTITFIAILTVILEVCVVTFFSVYRTEEKPVLRTDYQMKSLQRQLPDVPITKPRKSKVVDVPVEVEFEKKKDESVSLADSISSSEEPNASTNEEEPKVDTDKDTSEETDRTSLDDSKFKLIGNKRTALVIITYNRPNYLRRTVSRVFEVLNDPLNTYSLDMIISQDGFSSNMNEVIREIQDEVSEIKAIRQYHHFNHEQITRPNENNYFKLCRHFKWIFDRVLFEMDYDQIIVLEDDLDIAIDFFEYFSGVAPYVWKDPSLLAASAWNDNGFAQFVSDPSTIVRSDFFPGLGWLLIKPIWKELSPIWPEAYWDDWLRHPLRRKGRAILRPEVSRTYTFGVSGTSNAQFYNEYLKPIHLNTQFVSFSTINLSYLNKYSYDIEWKAQVNKATPISVSTDLNSLNPSNTYKILYKPVKNGYEQIARQIGLMANTKAGVPRGAYMGVVPIRVHGAMVYVTPTTGPSFDYVEY